VLSGIAVDVANLPSSPREPFGAAVRAEAVGAADGRAIVRNTEEQWLPNHEVATIGAGDTCAAGIAVAAAGTGGLLAWFAEAHSWATALASVIVAGAWSSIGLQSRRARRRPSSATLARWLSLRWYSHSR
jgi:hypothetical protein